MSGRKQEIQPHGWALALLLVLPGATCAEDATTTVGLPRLLRDVVLPGGELEVTARGRHDVVTLRIVQALPHGAAWRYDFEFSAAEPGRYNLCDHLRRADRSPAGELPPVLVTVAAVLPPGQIKPHELMVGLPFQLGGYRTTLLIAAVFWMVGLGLLLLGRRRAAPRASAALPLTLADRLRPLIEATVAGKVGPARLAELERALIVYWAQKLRIREDRPALAMTRLRAHTEAGPLLDQLERWLHQPAHEGPVDVEAILRPYRNLPPDALAVGSPP